MENAKQSRVPERYWPRREEFGHFRIRPVLLRGGLNMGENMRECRKCRAVMVGPGPDGRLGACGCFYGQPCYSDASGCKEFAPHDWIQDDKGADNGMLRR